jgi:hypothetical protein
VFSKLIIVALSNGLADFGLSFFDFPPLSF